MYFQSDVAEILKIKVFDWEQVSKNDPRVLVHYMFHGEIYYSRKFPGVALIVHRNWLKPAVDEITSIEIQVYRNFYDGPEDFLEKAGQVETEDSLLFHMDILRKYLVQQIYTDLAY